MEYLNLSFKWKESKFYEKSSEPKEGFKEVKYIDKETGKETSTYHRLQDNIKGVITSVQIADMSWGAKMLKVSFRTGEKEITTLAVNLEGKYGYTKETMSLIGALRNYRLEEEVTMTAKVNKFTKKNGKEDTDVSFYINYDNIKNDEGKSTTTGYIEYSELPDLVKVEKRGITTYDNDARMDFFYNILQDIIKRFDDYWKERKANSSSPQDSTPKEGAKTSTPVPQKFDDDDLPF